MFKMYFQLGFGHISGFAAMDHIVFIIALCASYRPREYKKLLVLATSFTVGHSITLALSVLGVIGVSAVFVELLIPATILITAVLDLLRIKTGKELFFYRKKYLLALFFGLIHGLGFSYYLKALLGEAQQLTLPLMAFNLGLEVGQLIIISIFVFVAFIFTKVLKFKFKYWTISLSLVSAIFALFFIVKQLFVLL